MALPSSGAITLAQIQTEFGGASPISLSEYYKGGAYVGASDAAPNVPASGAISVGNFYGAAKSVVGQVAYTTPGTYSWVCPAGVTSVCVVCVGAGGYESAQSGTSSGGSGGNLAYGNGIPVTPGNTYTVKVGAPVASNDYATSRSYFISTAVLMAGGGMGISDLSGAICTSEANAGAYLNGGGKGGNSGGYAGGGGGAGGYSGAGGIGGSTAQSGVNGAGGGGGGGFGYSSGGASGGGGGVGILGQGVNGTGGVYATSSSATGGSGGGNPSGASFRNGGVYGGGGGYSSDVLATAAGGGAVRIIWGSGRAFPSTNTGNL